MSVGYMAAQSNWLDPVAAAAGDPKPSAIEIENPGPAERILWFYAFVETRLSTIHAVLNGSGSPSVTFTVRIDTDRSAVGTELLTGGRVLTNITTGVAYVPDVTTIPAGSYVWIQTTARSGSVLELHVAMELLP